MTIFQTQLSLHSSLETETTGKTAPNTIIPNISSELLKRKIVYQGPKIWNSLKNDIKIKKTIFSFKKTLKKKLLVF